MTDQIRIFDTTLRDGEQSPGATLDQPSKVEIARQLARLGVDVIEAGFPAASPGDLEAVACVAQEVGQDNEPIVAGLARATRRDIDACWQAVRHARRPRIHTFIATSDVHLRHKLQMSRAQVLDRAREMVAYARSLCADVEFSAEDASRSDPQYLYEVFAAAIEAGATTINIPDTVGYAQPEEFAALVRGVIENVPGGDRCVVSVHCHDDLGLATANTIAGLCAGARQAECTVNGIGERAGNASLEEIVMALHTRVALYGLRTNINTTQITRASHLVAARTGISVPPNKAVVGGNAFAHEAGIHQDGVIKHAATYEIMRPETVGLAQSRLVLGKHSGRHALRRRLEEIGCGPLTDEELQRLFARFKRVADTKKQVTDAELEALFSDQVQHGEDPYGLHGVHVSCGAPSIPTASVTLRDASGQFQTRAAIGNGPVNAIFTAINHIIGRTPRLCEYAVHAVSSGGDALGEVTVRIRPGPPEQNVESPDRAVSGQEGIPGPAGEATKPRSHEEDARPPTGAVFNGHGADTDTLVASAKAYLAAVNRLIRAERRYQASGKDRDTALPALSDPIAPPPEAAEAAPSAPAGAPA